MQELPASTLWLLGGVALFGIWCLYLGHQSARRARTVQDYILAGRQLPLWVFVLAATAISFSGFTLIGHPAMIYHGGIPYASISLFTIVMPLSGILFMKRQWILGKVFGYTTQGDMLASYYKSNHIRLLSILIAICYAVPFMGVQLSAAGYLLNILSNGFISTTVGIFALSTTVFIYMTFGGMRAIAYAASVQCIILALGMIAAGVVSLDSVGGLDAFIDGLARMGRADHGQWQSFDAYNAYLAIPPHGETAFSTPWTYSLILTFLLAFMGIQASPIFSLWCFSAATPRPFAPQQVWASGLILGGLLVVFSVIQGLVPHMLGATPSLAGSGVPIDWQLPTDISDNPDTLVPYLMTIIQESAPWLVAFFAIAALSGMQSAGAALVTGAAAIITRDYYRHFIQPQAGDSLQKFVTRLCIFILLAAAVCVALNFDGLLVPLGGMAIGFGLQMFPALLGVCWIPWIKSKGVIYGLYGGILALIFTDQLGLSLLALLGLTPWEQWPLSLHSSAWGLGVNIVICLITSALSKGQNTNSPLHRLLDRHARITRQKRRYIPLAWLATGAWTLFAIGPFAPIGNDIFGRPDFGTDLWLFSIPSLWAWQILFWILGVALLWFLAYFMGLSTVSQDEIETIYQDHSE